MSLRGWSIRPQTALDFKLLIIKLDLLMKFLRKFKQDLHSFFGDDVEIGGPKLSESFRLVGIRQAKSRRSFPSI